jgi:probable selenium-dependent hydroxylase accessory protein YqeC
VAEPVSLNTAASSLGLLDGGKHHVAIVGGGGKTTLVFALADQLPGATVVTSTTKMGADQHRGLPVLMSPDDDELRAGAATSTVVAWDRVDGHKAIGVAPERCDRWFGLVDHVVVEADGSRQQPFKAPGVREPVVPVTATSVLSVIGANALGRVIADSCHRPLRVAALADCSPYERLTPAAAAAVLLHERGARRSNPPEARFAVVVNQVADANHAAVDALIGQLLTRDPELGVLPIATHPQPQILRATYR